MTRGVDKFKNRLSELLEIQDIIWYNYYSLVTSAVEALAIIWHEYANGSLEDTLRDDYGMTDAEISAMMLSLTMGVTHMPHDKKRTPASDMDSTIKAVSE